MIKSKESFEINNHLSGNECNYIIHILYEERRILSFMGNGIPSICTSTSLLYFIGPLVYDKGNCIPVLERIQASHYRCCYCWCCCLAGTIYVQLGTLYNVVHRKHIFQMLQQYILFYIRLKCSTVN